jgi:hypothetical protein
MREMLPDALADGFISPAEKAAAEHVLWIG